MKIKKVVIEGFRAYAKSGDGVFNFTLDDDAPANFVSIYAPNGFGKTSFYDAVEWALTDNIGRFVRDQTRQENDIISKSQNPDGKKPPILRNHSISPDDPSYVEVLTDSFVERKPVPKPAKNRRDYIFKKETTSKGRGISEIFLSQEAIDAFLREEKPDARYARFMASFSDADETYRSNLAVLKRDINVILRDLKEKEDALDILLETQPKLEIFEQINQTITSLKTKSETINQIGQDFDLDNEREFRALITRRRHELSIVIDQTRSSIAELNGILVRFTEIVTAHRVRGESKQQAEKTLGRRERFVARRDLNLRLTNLLETISSAQVFSSQINSIIDRLPAYLDALEKSSHADLENDQLRLQLREVEAHEQGYNQRIITCKTVIDEIDRSIRERVDLQRAAPLIFEQIATVREELKSRRNKEEVSRERLKSLGHKIEAGKEQISRISEIETNEDFLMVGNLSPLAPYGFSALPLTKALLDKTERFARLNDSTLVLERIRAQSSKIFELLTLGAEVATTGSHSHCPLCSYDHSSFEILIERIRNNPSLSHLEADAIRTVEIAQQAAEEANFEVAKLLADWKYVKRNAIESLRTQVNKDEILVSNTSAELEITLRDITQLTEKLKDLEAKVTAASVSDLASRLTDELERYAEQRKAQVEDIANCISELAKLDLSVKNLKQSIELKKSQASLLTQSHTLVEVRDFCTKHQLNHTELLKELREMLVGQNERISKFKDLSAVTEQEIAAIDLIDPSLVDVQPDQFETEIELYNTSALHADMVLVPYFAVIKKYFPKFDEAGEINQLDKYLEDEIESLDSRLGHAVKVENEYSLLNDQILEVMPYLTYLEARKNKDALLVEKFGYESVYAAIDVEYRSVIARLQSRIDNFFYTDLINSIYRKIDPHPDFKEVRFICDFSESEKPKLHVLVSDSSGETIAPSLYFSAAQVNILSLSIFLARALHANADGVPIKCIFIDDPIHSMDSINVLSTIDLLRAISIKFDRQIVLSTHDKNFFELLQRKVPKEQYRSKFIELESFGKVSRLNG